MKPASWMKIHAYISMFFLPLALIYSITGAMILLGNRGERVTQKIEINSPTKWKSDIDFQKKFVEDYLKSQNLTLPAGEPRIFRGKFFWGFPTSNMIAIEEQSENPIKIELMKPNWAYRLIMLHKGKGGRWFDYFGIAFAISMILIYLSGIVIFWKIKDKRKTMTIWLVLGSIATAILVSISL